MNWNDDTEFEFTPDHDWEHPPVVPGGEEVSYTINGYLPDAPDAWPLWGAVTDATRAVRLLTGRRASKRPTRRLLRLCARYGHIAGGGTEFAARLEAPRVADGEFSVEFTGQPGTAWPICARCGRTFGLMPGA